MAGKLTVTTLNNDTGVLATQNGMTGIAKAWINFNGTGTPAIRASFNISSITDNGTGDFTLNFTTAMPDANYSVIGIATHSSGSYASMVFLPTSTPLTTTTARINILSNTFGLIDPNYITVAVFAS